MMSVSSERDAATAGCCADCGQLVMRRTPLSDSQTKTVREVCIRCLVSPTSGGSLNPAAAVEGMVGAKPSRAVKCTHYRAFSVFLPFVVVPQSPSSSK